MAQKLKWHPHPNRNEPKNKAGITQTPLNHATIYMPEVIPFEASDVFAVEEVNNIGISFQVEFFENPVLCQFYVEGAISWHSSAILFPEFVINDRVAADSIITNSSDLRGRVGKTSMQTP